MYKHFFVSKSDIKKVEFAKDAISRINPKNVYILVEDNRCSVYKDIDAVMMPLKRVNTAANWIEFVNTFDSESLLIVDNVIKCIHYGDGKKAYIRQMCQSIDNVLVMDNVPFYTEVYEIYYAFFLLGKGILGYNSYASFKANHFEELENGDIVESNSFGAIQEKIKLNYTQDYESFFVERTKVEWLMSDLESDSFQEVRADIEKTHSNPIKSITRAADTVNLMQSKASALDGLVKDLVGSIAVVINIKSYEKKIRKMLSCNDRVRFITFHTKDLSDYAKFDHVVFYDNIIVKPHNMFYIEPHIKGKCYVFLESNSKIDNYLYSRIYDSETRDLFNQNFHNV